MRIAFDIDDTLWKVREDKGDQVPDYDLIQVLRWFYNNGDSVFVWSAGGVDYAQQIVRKLGLDDMVTVIPKSEPNKNRLAEIMDIAFDDCETELAKVDIRVNRSGSSNALEKAEKKGYDKAKKEVANTLDYLLGEDS